MGTADDLLKLMYLWMQQRKSCVSELRKLANELESLRTNCNGADCIGSVYSLVGSACLLTAGGLTLLSGGAGAPLLAIVGSVVGGTGLTVQVGSKVTEGVLSHSTMKEAQTKDQESNSSAEKIQELYKKLRKDAKPCTNDDELEHHIMAEMVSAMARRKGLTISINPVFFRKSFTPTNKKRAEPLKVALAISYAEVLVFFSLLSGGTKFQFIVAEGARRLVAKMSEVGLRVLMKGGATMAVGAAVGVVFALREAFDSWAELINKNHVTEASLSLKTRADEMDKMNDMLNGQLEQIQGILEEMENNEDRDEDRDEEEEAEKDDEKDEETNGQGGASGSDHEDEDEDKDKDEDEDDEEEEESEEETDDEESSEAEANCPPLRVGIQNVRSANNKMPQISNVICHNNLDALLTSETWLQTHNQDAVLQQVPEGYDYYHRPRGSRGGGVGVIFNSSVMHEWMTHQHQFVLTTFEFMGIVLTHPSWNEQVLFLNVYRRPRGNLVQFGHFLGELQMILDAVQDEFRCIVLVGDFNIWVDVEQRTTTRRFLTLMQRAYGFRQFVNRPTHTAGHTLDLVLGRNVNISDLQIQDIKISDHFTVTFTIKIKRQKKK